MLTITVTVIPEQFDESNNRFIEAQTVDLQMEHSLVTISEWESKWRKSFISSPDLSDEEIFDYIRIMNRTPNIPLDVYDKLTTENVNQIRDYINAPMTATTFSDNSTKKGKSEIITSELIYYWMISLQIPVEFEHWHLNRLITLIRVFNIKNAPPKKQSKSDIMRRNAALNAQRRAKLNSTG